MLAPIHFEPYEILSQKRKKKLKNSLKDLYLMHRIFSTLKQKQKQKQTKSQTNSTLGIRV